MSEQELRAAPKAPGEPLPPIEKTLIGWSLGVGVTLSVIVNPFPPLS